MHKCGKCHAEFDGNFCPQCGTKWEPQVCPQCGAVVSGNARFCNECGAFFGEGTAKSDSVKQNDITQVSVVPANAHIEKPGQRKGFVQGVKETFGITGHCSSCSYYDKTQKTFLHDGTCLRMGKGVDRTGTCNDYVERASKSNSGYKSGCFLTSACVGFLGKPDDCEELTALRRFRDTYMAQTEEGKTLVAEYYDIAPGIVEKIDMSSQKADTYSYIYSVIEKCVALIKRGENRKTMREYKNMVMRLKKEYVV